MRKIFKLLALSLAFVLLVGSLASCSHRLSGTYKASNGVTYVFDGDEFTYTAESSFITKGTFEIVKQDEDYRILLTITHSGKNVNEMTPVAESYVIGGVNGLEYRFTDLNGNKFEDGRIKIDSTWYIPVK